MNMITRSITTRGLAHNGRNRSLNITNQAFARRSYASAPKGPKSSNNLIWIVGALGLTGVGSYVALSPASASEHKEHAKQHLSDAKEKVKDKAEEAAERERRRDEERKPKPNPDADSESRHQKASGNNQHKVRHGKFSDVVFDNHDTSHSLNPEKDFEKIKEK